jgi:hypothetical protein
MEHDTGSGADPAAMPGTRDRPSAPRPGGGDDLATGEPRVDAVLGRLDELDELPVSEHPAVFERIHEQLVEVLGELHPGQGPAGQGPAGGRAR